MSTRLRILHLEDNVADTELVQETLAMAGFSCDVVRVQTENEFVSALHQGGFDLILADYTLPSFDGLSALDIARKLKPDLPFMFFSGTMGEEVAIESLKVGATDYILKTRLSRLVPSVQRALREAQERAELQEAERKLREREAKIRRLVEANIVGIFTWDFEGKILEANDAFLKIVGYDRDDLDAGRMRWTDLTPPEWLSIDLQKWVPELKISGRLHPFEKEYFRKDGTRVPVLIGVATLDDSGKEGVAFVLDLTERKRAEESLAFSSFALNNVRESAFLVDENHRFHYVNEEACRALGYTSEELLGMGVPDVDPDFPMERWQEHWALLKSNRSLIFESHHRAKNGRVFPVEVNSSYFEYAGKAYILGLARDITERKQAEKATLEARVSERTRIARELHDTLLQSFHGLLLRFQTVSQLLPDSPIDAKEKLESAIEQAAHAITEGREAVQGLRDSTVHGNDLAQALNTLGEDLGRDPINRPPAGFHVSSAGRTRNFHPIILGEIYEIAAEAMRNAFRHADAQRVDVEIRYDDDQFRMRVRDDGKGIDPAVLACGGGEGHYGMRGMRERATILGGELTMSSEVGARTEVELRIPARKAYQTESSSSFHGSLSGD